ncbi:MAG: precorrin-8X methylmutase [Acidimicrobiia bacterium]|nr:precorrin-8X methylmutase [Acidimicrobiia bacterium]
MRLDYERDGAAIYRASFATIRAEADLATTPPDFEAVVVRMIHASGMTDLPPLVAASADFGAVARAALRAGAPILADSRMVANGITRSRLPADSQIVCTLDHPDVPAEAQAAGTTRSAAAVDRWLPVADGAVAVFGNAPTALFRLLELVLDGQARPAAIIGLPVGFVGAAESKEALATLDHGVPYLILRGRRGGSAMAAAAVNALASDEE